MSRFEKILKKYPNRFLSEYFECNEGWADLIEEYLIELEKLDPYLVVKIDVIKEKFGHLTIITLHDLEDPDDKIDKIGEKYRRLSKDVCEMCGKKGRLFSLGAWLKTLCEGCKIARQS